MTGPPSGIHPGEGPSTAIPIDALVAFAGNADGVRRRDLASGDRIVVSTRNSVYSLSLRSDGAFEASGGRQPRSSAVRSAGTRSSQTSLRLPGSTSSSPTACARPG